MRNWEPRQNARVELAVVGGDGVPEPAFELPHHGGTDRHAEHARTEHGVPHNHKRLAVRGATGLGTGRTVQSEAGRAGQNKPGIDAGRGDGARSPAAQVAPKGRPAVRSESVHHKGHRDGQARHQHGGCSRNTHRQALTALTPPLRRSRLSGSRARPGCFRRSPLPRGGHNGPHELPHLRSVLILIQLK